MIDAHGKSATGGPGRRGRMGGDRHARGRAIRRYSFPASPTPRSTATCPGREHGRPGRRGMAWDAFTHIQLVPDWGPSRPCTNLVRTLGAAVAPPRPRSASPRIARPRQWRSNGPLANQPAFGESFTCRPASRCARRRGAVRSGAESAAIKKRRESRAVFLPAGSSTCGSSVSRMHPTYLRSLQIEAMNSNGFFPAPNLPGSLSRLTPLPQATETAHPTSADDRGPRRLRLPNVDCPRQ